MTHSSSPSPTSSVVNSVIASADEESVEAPQKLAVKKNDDEHTLKSEQEEEESSPSKTKKDKEDNQLPEKITTLPNIITDEEGVTIPEAADGASLYQYRDFSNVPEEELDQQPLAAPPPPSSRGAVESSIRVQKFPVKLYAILSQKEFADIVCWMPHGRSWKVLKPNLFESLVMPLFFEYSNYHSFNRLVNAWSFRRISAGPDRGSYYHELFLRGKPYLQKYMRRLPKTHKKLPMKKEHEPDFYAMDKANPLPAVDDAPLTPGIPAESAMMRGAMSMGAPGGMSPMRGAMAGGEMMANREMMMMRGAGGMSPMRGAPDMMAGYKDPLLSRGMGGMSGIGGMGMGGIPPMSTMGGMPSGMMGGMSSMGGMGGMPASMGGMHGMSGMSGMMGGMDSMSSMGMGGMPPMSSIGGMGSMAGMGMSGMSPMSSAFRESQAASAGDMEFQRLRQIQQMHMLDRQMGQGSMNMPSSDPFDRMRNMEMGLRR